MNTTTFTTYRLGRNGMVLPGTTRKYGSDTAAIAAGHAARRLMTAGEYATADVHQEGDVWTFTPTTGAQVIIWVTPSN
jgi:hypothetical protein